LKRFAFCLIVLMVFNFSLISCDKKRKNPIEDLTGPSTVPTPTPDPDPAPVSCKNFKRRDFANVGNSFVCVDTCNLWLNEYTKECLDQCPNILHEPAFEFDSGGNRVCLLKNQNPIIGATIISGSLEEKCIAAYGIHGKSSLRKAFDRLGYCP